MPLPNHATRNRMPVGFSFGEKASSDLGKTSGKIEIIGQQVVCQLSTKTLYSDDMMRAQ